VKKILILIPILIILIVLAFVPFETTLVPEWKVKVIDENGNPYVGKLVRQSCHNYTLGVSPCSGVSDSAKITDKNGYVVFQKERYV